MRHNRIGMLRPLFRHFEFEYADGYLFWDNAGRVARDLTQAIPGLQFRNQLIDQREFFVPTSTLELVYGIRLATLRSWEEDAAQFRKQTGLLVEILSEDLELETLTRFRFQLVIGWPCKTQDEAHAVSMKLLPEEVSRNVKTGEFQAAQLEIRKSAIVATTRYMILELAPPPGPARPDFPGPRVPYSAVSATYEGFDRLSIREFKTVAHLEEMENFVTTDFLKRITTKPDAKPS